jgi:hypothetical protein
MSEDAPLFEPAEPPLLIPSGFISLADAVAIVISIEGDDGPRIAGCSPAEGRIRRLAGDGTVSAVVQLHDTGESHPMPSAEWAGPRAPMFFENGTVSIPTPGNEEGIWASVRVNEAQLRAALQPQDAGGSPAPRPIVSSGAAGRPTSMHLILAEERRLIAAGTDIKSMNALAEHLSEWLTREHPDAPSATAKTIKNNSKFKSLYRAAKAKQLSRNGSQNSS